MVHRRNSSKQRRPAEDDMSPEKQLENMHRNKIREELIYAAGSARYAFNRIDLNGSGNISLQEFAEGVERMGVKWTEITGLKRERELFKLFDQDKDSVITFAELFPDEATRRKNPERCSTPEFWGTWVKNTGDWQDIDLDNPKAMRKETWKPHTRDEELELMQTKSDHTEEVQNKKKWMSATIRRLKSRGKSDARCREVVALHLPRGTGPKDREDVQTFTQVEVRSCKKIYTDQYMDPVKNIQKFVGDMKEQKREVRNLREELYQVTEGKNQQQRMEEERRTSHLTLQA